MREEGIGMRDEGIEIGGSYQKILEIVVDAVSEMLFLAFIV